MSCLEIDPSDAWHMFWDGMKRLFFAMREIEPDDLDDEMMEDFLKPVDAVSNILQLIEKKRRVRGGKHKECERTAHYLNISRFW